jgi:hypothetical protein
LDHQPAAFADDNIRSAAIWECDGEHIGGEKINSLISARYHEHLRAAPHGALFGGSPKGVALLLLYGSVFSLPHCLGCANAEQFCG